MQMRQEIGLQASQGGDLPRGCTFAAADWAILARHWYPIALEREIEDGPVAAKLLDERLVVYRVGTEIVVAQELCPHRGVPLSMGTYDGGGVVCRYHGLRYGVHSPTPTSQTSCI
jgi:phenylpropionate dioxygenase-like ring-hydroxylating dioxygenase large terminal subunit